MIENEPISGYNLPPGCLDDDIDREFGGERRYCSECRHCIVLDELGCAFCAPKLAGAGREAQGRAAPVAEIHPRGGRGRVRIRRRLLRRFRGVTVAVSGRGER